MYSRFSIQTRLSTVEAEDTLARLVAPRRHDASPAKPFIGRVEGGTFKFHRAFVGRNSFIPIISGRIVEGDGGALVRGAMRLHWAVAVVMTGLVWMGIGVGAGVLAGSVATADTFAVFFALVFPVFGIVLMSIGYFPERRKAMRLLEDAFRPLKVGTEKE